MPETGERWLESDPNGREVVLYEGAWKHIKEIRQHVLADETTFEADMKSALQSPILSHELLTTASFTAGWAYYACSTDPDYSGYAVMVIAARRQQPPDVIKSARLVTHAHSDASTRGVMLETDSQERLFGEPLCGQGAYRIASDLLAKLEELRRNL